MTVGFAPETTPTQAGPGPHGFGPTPDTPRGKGARGTRLGIRAGQVVAAQAAIALLFAASSANYLVIALAAVLAAIVVVVAWVRLRGRWLYEWLGVGLRYLSRRHTLAPDSNAAGLLDLFAPDARVVPADIAGDAAAVISDGYGMTAVIELGDPAGLLAESAETLPSPASLLPPAGTDMPRVRVQLVVAGVSAPVARAGAATSATSYRQLTEGRLLGQERALLAVRILREEGWSEEDLRRALSGVVRKVRRRLGDIPSRALGETAVLHAITDLAQHDGVLPAREAWPAVHLGGLLQVSFRITRWPDLRTDTARRLVSRLLTLPTAATTVALATGPRGESGTGEPPVDLVVRLAAADASALAAGVRALHQLLGVDGTVVRRLDGEQLEGFAATLPLGGADASPVPGAAPRRTVNATVLKGMELPIGVAGLMIGTNRRGSPVLARLFRPEPTRVMLVGGVRCAQLVAVRAMALGARVVVQTARPYAWEPFVRGVSTPGETIAVIPPGRPVSAAPGTALHPLLVMVDVGPVGVDGFTGGGWQASLVVRDDLATVDVDALARADLVILQQLRPDEAALAGSTLGLGDAAGWLTRIRPDMVGVVNRRVVRWALLSATQIEQQLIGSPSRG